MTVYGNIQQWAINPINNIDMMVELNCLNSTGTAPRSSKTLILKIQISQIRFFLSSFSLIQEKFPDNLDIAIAGFFIVQKLIIYIGLAFVCSKKCEVGKLKS